ncbi:MAG: hypothetical protein [Olavius algarvensis Delta 4 endosymbiont]|nr:MAG: hypothetical protein [Olavius algarvensis Delta 4 endosymbiont]
MYRSFKQRRLPEGQATVNMATIHTDIKALIEAQGKADSYKAVNDCQGLYLQSVSEHGKRGAPGWFQELST